MKNYLFAIASLLLLLCSCEKDGEKEYVIASKTRVYCAEGSLQEYLIKAPSQQDWKTYDDPLVGVIGLSYEAGYEYRVKGRLKHHKDNPKIADDFSSNTLVVSEVLSKEKKESENLPAGKYWDPAWPSWYYPCSGLSVEEYREKLLAEGQLVED